MTADKLKHRLKSLKCVVCGGGTWDVPQKAYVLLAEYPYLPSCLLIVAFCRNCGHLLAFKDAEHEKKQDSQTK